MSEQLSGLVKLIFTNKSFMFKTDSFPLDCELLTKNELLRKIGNDFHASINPELTEAFFEYFGQFLDFKLTEDFHNAVDFYKKFESYFKVPNAFVNGLSRQKEALLQLLIKKSLVDHGVDFSKFLSEMERYEEDGFNDFQFDFTQSLARVLPDLAISSDGLLKVVEAWVTELEKAQDDIDSIHQVCQAIKTIIKRDEEFALDFYKLCRESDLKSNHLVFSYSLSGVYESNRQNGSGFLKEVAKTNDLHLCLIKSLGLTNPESPEETNLLLDIVDGISSNSNETLKDIPRIYANAIKDKRNHSKDIIDRYRRQLRSLLANGDVDIKRSVLWSLRWTKQLEDERFELIEEFIRSETETEDYKQEIADIVKDFNSQNHLFSVLTLYGLKEGTQFKSKTFERSLDEHRERNSEGFSKSLILLLIHDEGKVRYMANDILSHLSFVRGEDFRFEYDILNLDALQQYKLWVSVFAMNPAPKRSFPLLINLCRSQFSFVKEAFICKLEEYVDNYSSAVLAELEKLLSDDNIDDHVILERVKKRYKQFKNDWDEKFKIKEFDPRITQSKLYEQYEEDYNGEMSLIMEESMNQTGTFLDLFQTVILAKGGGWKSEHRDDISKLGLVQTGVQMPRLYNISPERFDYDMRFDTSENWKNAFDEWEVIISS